MWFVQLRCKGTPISGPLLMAKALQLYPLIYPNDPDPSSFKAGTGWLKRFKNRHGIRALSVQVESQSAASESVNPFKEHLQELIEEKGLSLNQLFNCDETGLYWKLMPNKTLVSSREKEAKGFKVPKDCVTIMPCANATGSINFPLLSIHKSLNPRCFKMLPKVIFQSTIMPKRAPGRIPPFSQLGSTKGLCRDAKELLERRSPQTSHSPSGQCSLPS